MMEPMPVPPSPPPAAGRRRKEHVLWVVGLAVIAAGGFVAVHRAVGPRTRRYRLERLDRGSIRRDVTAPGTLIALANDVSRIQLAASVAEADVAGVAVGENAILRVEAYPVRMFKGTVSDVRTTRMVGQVVTEQAVLVDVDDRARDLRPGMSATASIEVARREGVLRLPRLALSYAPAGMAAAGPVTPHEGRVFVLDHGHPRAVSVTIGLQDLRYAQVVAGVLREGDAVIIGER